MSGGGGGGGGGNDDGYGAAPSSGPCNRFNTETAVQSPNPQVVGRLATGQLLNVFLDGKTVFVQLDQETVGTLIFLGLPRLIECLEEGFEFVAEVVRLSGPDCRVRVRPR